MVSGARSNNRRDNNELRFALRRYNRRLTSSEISCCVKYAVFGFNVIFWVIGFLLLCVGMWAHLEKNNVYSQLNRLSKFYMDPAWILIIIGALIFLIGFSGCIGALRENTFFLAIYSSILGLLLLTEAIIVVMAFFSKDVVENDLTNRLEGMIVHYRDDPDLQTFIDWIQRDFQCCGVNDPDDWDKNVYFNSSAKSLASPDAGGVPFSCCKNTDEAFTNYACGQATRLNSKQSSFYDRIHPEGCLPRLNNWLNNNFIYVGTTVFIIAVIQFLGICFAQDLRSDIFAQRSKWSHHRY